MLWRRRDGAAPVAAIRGRHLCQPDLPSAAAQFNEAANLFTRDFGLIARAANWITTKAAALIPGMEVATIAGGQDMNVATATLRGGPTVLAVPGADG